VAGIDAITGHMMAPRLNWLSRTTPAAANCRQNQRLGLERDDLHRISTAYPYRLLAVAIVPGSVGLSGIA
jgi:hypothetical protein